METVSASMSATSSMSVTASPAAGTAAPPAGALCGAQWTISAGGQQAVLVETGGGLRAYRADGVGVLDEYDPGELPAGWSGKVLAPWANRIRDGRYHFHGQPQQLPLAEAERHNALHGLVAWVPWQPVEVTADSVTLECTLAAQPGYPWPLRLRTRWSVGPAGLRAGHEATNIGTRACPFGLGVHPYLRLGGPVDDLVLRVPARSRVLTDGRLLPIGAAKVTGGEFDYTAPRRIGGSMLDTAFGDLEPDPDGSSAVTVSTADRSRTVRVWADASFRWWQVYSGDTLPGERYRQCLAVEPMTGPPDALRSGRDVVVLEPGQTWTGTWGISPGSGG